MWKGVVRLCGRFSGVAGVMGGVAAGVAAGVAIMVSVAALHGAPASASALTQGRTCGGITSDYCMTVETCTGSFWRYCSTKYYSWSWVGPPVCSLCS